MRRSRYAGKRVKTKRNVWDISWSATDMDAVYWKLALLRKRREAVVDVKANTK